MTVLGYDVNEAFEGRGVLEAASMGVSIILQVGYLYVAGIII